jgi:cell division cycle 20-like protein 1 (cofactor of APC complex)
LNLVDWGSTNVLAVGLADCIYLWNASTAKVTKLCVLSPDDHQVTSVSWMDTGTHVAFGVSSGHVQLWDVQACKLVRDFKGHSARVGCLSWNSNTLTSGSRDHTILNRDIRSPQPYISKRTAHRQEVCGLKWSPDGRELASGGNDNKLFVWHPSHNNPVLRFNEHTGNRCWGTV